MNDKHQGKTIQVPAVRIRQGKRRELYSFAVDAKKIPYFATVSRIRRNDDADLDGYQRPEVLAHIQEIRDYIESESPLLPNALVIAFTSKLDFKPALVEGLRHGVLGTLTIPIAPRNAPPEERAGFIVDGQQRLAAIREASVPSFQVFVSAFVVDEPREQTEQFILVNAAKPLPKALIYELLPKTDARLPVILERRRTPARMLARLNHDKSSPLREKIRTVTNPDGKIKDNSLLKMLENSLSNGVLRRMQDERADSDAMFEVICEFWRAVEHVFGDAWDLKPSKSRLMHGAGVIGLGLLMDAIADDHRREHLDVKLFSRELDKIKDRCRWTEGDWDFKTGRRAWNQVQNTPKDVKLLADYLAELYKVRARQGREPGDEKRKKRETRPRR